MNMFVGTAAVAGASLIVEPARSENISRPLTLDVVRPELRDAFNRLKEAHGDYQLAHGAYMDANGRMAAWEGRNPVPPTTRAYRKWDKRSYRYANELKLESKSDAMMKARDAYRAAQASLGMIVAADFYEVAIKSLAAITFEVPFPQMLRERPISEDGRAYLRTEDQIVACSVSRDVILLCSAT